MTDCHSRMSLQEQTRDRSPNDLTPTNYASISARNFNFVSIQQLNDSCGRTGNESRPAHREVTYARRMKGINILGRIDRFDDPRVINLFWQRQLNQNPVNLVVAIQALYNSKQLIRRNRVSQLDLLRVDPNFLARSH